MMIQSSPHAPREGSRTTHRADRVNDVKWSRRIVRAPGSHHAERDGYFGNDTFSIDQLFFHRRRLTPLAPVGTAAAVVWGEGPGVRGSSPLDLKISKFQPEYVGQSRFYCAALDEQVRLPRMKTLRLA